MPEKTGLKLLDAHLKTMESFETRGEREAYIKKMSLEEMAQIVLAAREAFIKHVDEAIPPFNSLPILFLIGATGAGKSTTLSFLCGDKMTLENSYYKSDNKNKIISNDLCKSETFLPNIAKTNEYIIVDYPGFENSDGSLIELGIDLALKAHLLQYEPEVLVIESITNINGRFAESRKLADYLSRLINDYKNTVVLGITKYSQDCHYCVIQEAQQKIQSQESNLEVVRLEAGIKEIIKVIDVIPQPHKEEFQKKLHILQKKREELQTQPLPDNPAKNTAAISLEKIERELSNQIGTSKFIQLKELESTDRLKSILEELKTKGARCIVAPQRLMKIEHQQLLKDKFTNDFITHWAAQPYAQMVENQFKDFAAVEKAITESSLINTILAKDIGVLFHLPQMPLSTLKEMDEILMAAFLDPYLKSVIKLTLTCFNNLNQLPGNVNAKLLQNKIKDLRRELYEVLELSGTEEEKEKKLNDYEGGINLDKRSLPERFKPSWMNNFTYLTPEVPNTLDTLSRNILREILPEQAKEAIDEIESLQATLKDLSKINEVVKRTQVSLKAKQQKRDELTQQSEEQRKRDEQRLREENQKKKSVLTYYRTLDPETVAFFKNIECVEELRKQLDLLARRSVLHSSVVYKALLALAELKPVNEKDPFTLEEISKEDKIIVTEGQQFSLTNLIQFHNRRPNRDDEIEGKFLINTYTNTPFVAVDAAHVLKLARERKIEIMDLDSVNLVQQCNSLPLEKTLASDDKSTEMQQLSDKISFTTIAIRDYMNDVATTGQLNELKKTLTRLTETLASFLDNTEDQQLPNIPISTSSRFFKDQKERKGYDSTHLHTDYVSANNA